MLVLRSISRSTGLFLCAELEQLVSIPLQQWDTSVSHGLDMSYLAVFKLLLSIEPFLSIQFKKVKTLKVILPFESAD